MTWIFKNGLVGFCIWLSFSEQCLLTSIGNSLRHQQPDPEMPSVFFKGFYFCFVSILTRPELGVGQSLVLCPINISLWRHPSHFTFQDSHRFEKCREILRADCQWKHSKLFRYKVSEKSQSFVTIWSENRLCIHGMI